MTTVVLHRPAASPRAASGRPTTALTSLMHRAGATLAVAAALAACGVTAPPAQNRVASISVMPDTATLWVGATLQFTANERDVAGNAVTGEPIGWSGDNPAVASVSATGLLTAIAAGGPVHVRATSGSTSGSAIVFVRRVPSFTVVVRRTAGISGTFGDTAFVADSGTAIAYAYQLLPGYSSLLVSIDDTPAAPAGSVLLDRNRILVASANRDLLSTPAVTALASQFRAISTSTDFAGAVRDAVSAVSGIGGSPEERAVVIRSAGSQAFSDGQLSQQDLVRMNARAGTIIPLVTVPSSRMSGNLSGTTVRLPKAIFVNGVFNDYGDYTESLSSLSAIVQPVGISLDGFFNPTWTSNPDYPVVGCLIKVSTAMLKGASISNLLPVALTCTSLFDLVTARNQINNVMNGFPDTAVPVARQLASRIKSEIDAGFAPVLLGHSQGNLMVAEALNTLYGQAPAGFRPAIARCLTAVTLAAPIGPIPVGAEQWRGIVLQGLVAEDVILLLGKNQYPRFSSAMTVAADQELGRWYNMPIYPLSLLSFDLALHSLSYGYLGAPESTTWLQSRLSVDAQTLRSQCTDVATVSPASASITAGGATEFAASRFTPTGTPVPSAVFTWSSSNPAVARIDNATPGRILGVSAGAAVITATSGDASDQVVVTVAAAPAAIIAAAPLTTAFTTTAGGTIPVAKAVAITNAGGGTLTGLARGTVTYQSGEPTGWLGTTSLNSTTAPATLTLQPSTTSLGIGTYHAVVPITATGNVSNSPLAVSVTYTVTAATLLSAPTLTAPADGSTGNSTTPTLSWSQVPGANRYWLMVARSPSDLPVDPLAQSCPNCVISGTTLTNSHSVPTPFPNSSPTVALDPGTLYYWKVQGFNNSTTPTTQGQYSATSSFSTVGVQSGVSLVFLTSPYNTTGGAVFSPGIQIGVVDAAGHIVTSATNLISITIIDASSTTGPFFTDGYNHPWGMANAAVNGVATFSNVALGPAGFNYRIVAMDCGVNPPNGLCVDPSQRLVGATSIPFSITTGPAARLVFYVEPSTTTRGLTMTPPVHVWITDNGGSNAIAGATNAITVSLTPGYGTLGASLAGTRTVNAVNGDASFNGLSISTPGIGYRLTATAVGLIERISMEFDIR